MRDMHAIVGHADVLLMTLDTLRYDVAQDCLARGETPNLAALLGPAGWELRHTPGSFTYAAHHAFFAGFLPTPPGPGPHPRPFAVRFAGSESIAPGTFVFDAPDIVRGFASIGYRTICIGGVGFFAGRDPLGRVLPSLFDEAHWEPAFAVTEPGSFDAQLDRITDVLAPIPTTQRVLVFLNVSAIHQPNRIFVPGATTDDLHSHAAALRHVDARLPRLVELMRRRGRWLAIVCSDHGTAYGEADLHGHRVAHETVWTVPYAELELAGDDGGAA
jgi:hypothetical protein